jgi:hypothetical protein
MFLLSIIRFNFLFFKSYCYVIPFFANIDSNETRREEFGIDSDWTAGKSDTTGGETW